MAESAPPPPPIPQPGVPSPSVPKGRNRGCLIAFLITTALGIAGTALLVGLIVMSVGVYRKTAPAELQRDPALLPETVRLTKDVSVTSLDGQRIIGRNGDSFLVVSIKDTQATLRKNESIFIVPLEATDGVDLILARAAAKREEQRKQEERQEQERAENAAREQTEAEERSAVWIQGRVISVVDDGLLVDNEMTHSVIFLKGHFGKVDGDKIWLNAIPTGTYKYTSVIGSAKTVHAFRPSRR